MSSICAVWDKTSEPSALSHAISEMVLALRSHGPERQNTDIFDHVALGFGLMRFSTHTDGNQPTRCLRSERFMVLDGRIDNRNDVCEALSLTADTSAALSDTQLLLLLWDELGKKALLKVHGTFAGLLFDARGGELLAFVDPFRQRSLYYHQSGGRVAFASAPKGLFADRLARRINRNKAIGAMAQYYGDLSSSYFEGVHAVPPGSIITVSDKGLQTEKYYRLSDHIRPVHFKCDHDYVEAANERLSQVVADQMRGASGQIGSFLTGGLDSSSIAVTALNHLPVGRKLPTFTMVPEPGWDGISFGKTYGSEREYVEQICAAYPRLSPTFVDTRDLDLQSHEMAFFHAAEIPVRNVINMVWFHAIFAKAKAQNVKVLLSGDAGNYGLSYDGRDLTRSLARKGNLPGLMKELSHTNTNFLSTSLAALRLMVGSNIPEGLWAHAYRLRFGVDPTQKDRTALAANLFETHFSRNQVTAMESVIIRDIRKWFIKAMEARYPALVGDVNRAFETIYGIEQRSPLTDRRIVEWAFGVPDTQFRRNGVQRWLVKRMMAGRLPEGVLNKRTEIGGQSVDWHTRLTREKAHLSQRIAMYREHSDLHDLVDWERIEGLMEDWPDKTINDVRKAEIYQVTLPQALHTAEFIKHFSGKNR